MRKKERQLELFASPRKRRGGKPGPKPKGPRPLVPHRRRVEFHARNPSHVTVRLRDGLPTLRCPLARGVLMKAFRKGCDRFGFRLVHYSIQGNHLHLLTEAEDRHALAKGMQGLLIRCAKALNRLWRRKGSVFADRYHNVVLDSPRRVRNALVYVLQNCRRHGARWRTRLDHFSSALWFRGWSGPARLDQDRDEVRPTTGPRSWLLRGGWKRRGGLISPTESPAPG